MRSVFLFLIASLIVSCANSKDTNPKKVSIIFEAGKTVLDRFNTPLGFSRIVVNDNSFENYLRKLPLKKHGSKVKLYNGLEKQNNVYHAVIDLQIGKKDLQQCADAVMRLRAEYLFNAKRFNEISFTLNCGLKYDYNDYLNGKTLNIKGNTCKLAQAKMRENNYTQFWNYMESIFAYTSTLSLAKNYKPVQINDIKAGDFFVLGGSPGHAVIVIDVAKNNKGEKIFMLAQSYMPAQEIQVLKTYNENQVWFTIPENGILETPEWTFYTNQLRRF